VAKRGPATWTKTKKANAKYKRTRDKRRKLLMETLLENLRQGTAITVACANADIGYTTYWGWLRAYPSFKAEVDKTLQSRLALVVDSLYASALERNTTALAMWLKGHDEHWRKALCMSYVGGTGPDGAVPLKVDGLAGMIKAALAKEKTGEEDAGGQADTGRPGQTVHLPPAEGGPAGKV
jgi:hypothetical protein